MPRHSTFVVSLLFATAACKPIEQELNCADRPSAALSPPDGLARFELGRVIPQDSEVAWGHVLVGHFRPGSSWVSVIDGCGEPTWWHEAEPGNHFSRARVDSASGSVRVAEFQRDLREDIATLHRIPVSDGGVTLSTRMARQHHDWVVHDDGTVAFLAWESRPNIWFDHGATMIASDALRTTPEGELSEDSDLLFSFFDDVGHEPWWSCDHMRQGVYLPLHSEWSHTNSLVLDAENDAYYLLARFWNSVIKLDLDGELQWILGGQLNEFELLGDTLLPLHGHMSDAWSGGALIFDNGNHAFRPSRVVRYAIDEDARTVRETWSFTDPAGRTSNFLGDARRLPGGNVLISWTPYGHMTEVDRNGRIVWEATTTDEIGRVEFVRNWRSF